MNVLKKTNLALLTALTAFGALPAQAQEEPNSAVVVIEEDDSESEEQEVVQIADVIVIGTRSELRRQESPVPVDSISRETIEASGTRTVSELLSQLSHIEFTEHVGGSGVQVQGLPSEHVLILVDGLPVGGRINGVIDLDRYRTANIERVEVLRGAGSTLYGADALAGVINIITRQPERPIEADATASYGMRNTLDLAGQVGTRQENWQARANISHSSSDGFNLNPEDMFTTGSAYNELSGGANGVLELSDSVELDSQVSYLRRRQERVESGAGGAIFDRVNLLEDLQGRLGAKLTTDSGFIGRASVFYELFRNQFLYDQHGSDALDRYEDSREHQARLELRGELPLGERQLLTVGVEGAMHRLDSPRYPAGDAQRFRAAIYAQDEIYLGSRDQFSILPGARLDVDTQFGVHPSPQLAIRWGVLDTLNLRASAGMGYRAPAFQELVLEFENRSAGYIIRGNPDLKPETSRSFQLGGIWMPLSWLELDVNLYHNQIENLISDTTVHPGGPTQPLMMTYDNIDAAMTRGVESTLRLTPWANWRFDIGYTLTDSLNLEQEDSADDDGQTRHRANRPLEGRARHRVTAGISTDALPLGLKAYTNATFVSSKPYFMDGTADLDEPVYIDPYVLLEARIARDFGDHFTVFLRGTNLLNAGEIRFLPIAPRTLYAGIQGRY